MKVVEGNAEVKAMAIYRRGKTWWVDCYVGDPPRRVRKSAKTRDESVARIVEQTLVGANRGVTPRQQAMGILDALFPKERQGLKLEDVVAWYRACLEDEHAAIKSRTMGQRLGVVSTFVAWAAKSTKARTADEVDVEVAFAYAKELGTRGMLGKTLNAYLSDLSVVWKMLLKRGKTAVNPWSAVRVRRDRENEHTGRAFTRDETRRIEAAAQEAGHEWYGMVVVGEYTGLRMKDIADLRWDEVDLKRRIITKRPGKTEKHGIRVTLPMHERVYRVLSDAARDQEGAWVFPYRHAHPIGNGARKGDVTFGAILEAAEVGKKDERDKLSFHCLRHTFVTRLAESGVAQDVRMRLAGHTVASTNDIYTHADEAARKAIEGLT